MSDITKSDSVTAEHIEVLPSPPPSPDAITTVIPTKGEIIEAVAYLHQKEKYHGEPYVEHGPAIDRVPETQEKVPQNPGLGWPRVRHTLREPIAEFLGTFIILMFGDGVVAQVVLSGAKNGEYQSITWGCKSSFLFSRLKADRAIGGIGVMLGVYTAGISGAHLNPAVTFANAVFRGFSWKKVPTYMIAQVLGAM